MRHNRQQQPAYEIKTILIGDCNTGKTTLFRAFVDGYGSEATQPTIAVDFSRKTVHADSYGDIVFQLWDTSGAEKFNRVAMTQMYYRHTQGVLLVFSVTDRASFLNITEVWLCRLRSALQMDEHYRCILIGNKADLAGERAVSTEEALALASQLGMDYVELSSLHSTATEIQQPFMMLAVQVMDAKPDRAIQPHLTASFILSRALNEPPVTATDEAKQENKCCLQH